MGWVESFAKPIKLSPWQLMGFRFVQPSYITGMMVSGASPIYAGIYQFIIVAMILATFVEYAREVARPLSRIRG